MSNHTDRATLLSRRKFLLASAAIAGSQVASTASASGLLDPSRNLPRTLAERLAAIEALVEAKRQELGVPGAALALVQDDALLMLKGFGVRDLAADLPVTPDTLFAIGSDTKGFTAAAAMIGQEQGALSLNDSPKKYLPYFRLADAEADANITIRDLLTHNSGVMRADIAWISGVLSREEVIRVAGLAKPTAKFRKAFQYQNALYMAAGEAVAKAHGTTWENVIETQLFAPLNMRASTTSIEAMRQTADFATGHVRTDGKLEASPLVDRSNIAGAGAITSNARDMAQWLRFLLGRGAIDGKRLMSLDGFKEMTRRHIAAGPAGYGLGFFVGRRGKYKTVFHGGNIDGFESHLFLVPELKLGFMLLTNTFQSALPAAVADAIWSNLVEDSPRQAVSIATADPKTEVGRYATVGASCEVVLREGNQLFAIFHGQPDYPLVPVGGRRYRFGARGMESFFVTFRASKEAKGQSEMYLEQPQGNLVMRRLVPANPNGGLSDAERELIGAYELNGVKVDIEPRGDFVLALIPGQHPYTLVADQKDLYAFAELPETYRLGVARGSAGEVTAIVFRQPEGEFAARRIAASTATPDITVDTLMAKLIAAVGGDELRRRNAIALKAEVTLENLGLTADGRMHAVLPDTKRSAVTLFGLGKAIGSIRSSCDGGVARVETSFSNTVQTGSCASDLDYASLLNWKTRWETVSLDRKTTFEGEDAYIVIKTTKGLRETDTVSAKSFLVLKRDSEIEVEGKLLRMASETYHDYRAVEGIMIPMRSETQHALLGRMVARVTDVKLDAEVAAL